MNNLIKTTLLLGTLTGLLLFFGSVFGGRSGMVFALGLAAVMNIAAYWYSDRIVLKLYKAQPVTEAQDPVLYSIVRELAARAGLPMPRVYVIPNPSPNAFATGRNRENAVVAVTDGIRQLLTEEELAGVGIRRLREPPLAGARSGSWLRRRTVLSSALAPDCRRHRSG